LIFYERKILHANDKKKVTFPTNRRQKKQTQKRATNGWQETKPKQKTEQRREKNRRKKGTQKRTHGRNRGTGKKTDPDQILITRKWKGTGQIKTGKKLKPKNSLLFNYYSKKGTNTSFSIWLEFLFRFWIRDLFGLIFLAIHIILYIYIHTYTYVLFYTLVVE
jgi:hypothetical protein